VTANGLRPVGRWRSGPHPRWGDRRGNSRGRRRRSITARIASGCGAPPAAVHT